MAHAEKDHNHIDRSIRERKSATLSFLLLQATNSAPQFIQAVSSKSLIRQLTQQHDTRYDILKNRNLIWSLTSTNSTDKAKERLSQISSHLKSDSSQGLPSSRLGKDALLQKSPDDVVVTCAIRTPFTKGGCVLAPGGGATEYRAAALAAGFPETTAVRSLNRQCSSGLQACVDVANQIKTGMIEIGIGSGVESMSTQYGPGAVTEFSELLEGHTEAANCKVPMGMLSEQMAKDRGWPGLIKMHLLLARTKKALKAQEQGLFDEEIMPVNIRAAFAKGGSIHAGNASQVSDGAAAVLLMKRSTAERLGQTILGKFVTASVVGVAPLLMGIGPWKAIPVALEKAGISQNDVDIFEIK
ncbi:hypothetical protein MRB53_039170 [Persea americana]|nr:hypothetical protein MRB53_039170 [Persea americana]